MRKVILGLGISLDGYIARPDNTVDYLFMPRDYSMAAFFASIDVTLMGRKTLDVARAHGGGTAFAGAKMATYVFSRTQPPGKRDGVEFVADEPAALVARLRAKPGKHIWLSGGGELARSFLQADAVDDLYLGVVPVLIGAGIPLFPPGFPQREFALVKNETFSQRLIALTYERVRKPAKKARRAKG